MLGSNKKVVLSMQTCIAKLEKNGEFIGMWQSSNHAWKQVFFWTNTTPKDVEPSQNNFAGLGATGGGVTGDSLASPEVGIEEQIQDLALRCDVAIPKEKILSEYAPSAYDTIANRHSKYWKNLAGTWATDPKYWDKFP